MTPVSTRFLLPLLAMLLLTASVVAVHFVGGLQHDDCAHPERLMNLKFHGTRVLEEVTAEYTSDVFQYTNGEFGGGAAFRWVRTFTGRYVYPVRPYWMVGARIQVAPQIHRFDVDGVELPIRFWVGDYLGQPHVGAYMLIHAGRPVASALGSGVGAAFQQLISGPTPVDFIAVHGFGQNMDPRVTIDAIASWMGEAWRYRQRACN
jgi:hypothetical protein